jgi:hypothetical protein
MIKLRNELNEVINDEEDQIKIQIDGNFKFCQLTIKENTPYEYIEQELPKLFNLAFENMAQKMKTEIEKLTTKYPLN